MSEAVGATSPPVIQGADGQVRRVAIFCGASAGSRPDYAAAAAELARALAQRGVTVIFGGGSVGLMGVVADAALQAGGSVIGVITRLLQDRELGHRGVTELHVVETMHERKMMMATMADGFVAIPGGLGTLDEFFEIMAWAQLGIHAKPVALLNTLGYYDQMVAMLETMGREGFLRLDVRKTLIVEKEAGRVVERLRAEVSQAVEGGGAGTREAAVP